MHVSLTQGGTRSHVGNDAHAGAMKHNFKLSDM